MKTRFSASIAVHMDVLLSLGIEPGGYLSTRPYSTKKLSVGQSQQPVLL